MFDNTIDQYFFFPFTHISHNDIDTVSTFFSQLHFLSLNKEFKHNSRTGHQIGHKTGHQTGHKIGQLIDTKTIIPYFVSSQIIELVEQKFKQYLRWVKTHQGNESNLKLLLKKNPYFTSNSDVTAIKSKLRKSAQKGQAILYDELNMQDDVLFLMMAQLYDEQIEKIDLKLEDFGKTSEDLFSILQGPEAGAQKKEKKSKKHKYADSGNLMVKERLSAWFRCLNAMKILRLEDKTSLFITTSKNVFNYLESNCKDVVNILDINNLKVHGKSCKNNSIWQEQLKSFLNCAIAKKYNGKFMKNKIPGNTLPEVNDQCTNTGQIKLCHFFGGNDINQIMNTAGKPLSVCFIKLY